MTGIVPAQDSSRRMPEPLDDGRISTRRLDLDETAHRQWAADTTAELAAMGCLHEHGRYSPTPITMPHGVYAAMIADVVRVLQLARRVARDTGEILEWARPDQRALVEAALEISPLPVIARPDGIVQDGHLKLLELNLDSGLGGYFEVELLQRRLAGVRALRAQGAVEVPTVMGGLQRYIEDLMRILGRDTAHIALMVDPHLTAYNRSHADLFVAEVQKRLPSVRVHVVASDQLHIRDDRVSDGISRFDILWRFGSLTHPEEKVAPAVSILSRALRSETLVVSSPSDLGVDGKLVLGRLSQLADDAAPELDAAERALVSRMVPWTRILSGGRGRGQRRDRNEEAIDTARRQRERLVLKRAHSKSSQQVLIGCETGEAEWRRQLETASMDSIPWVLQRNMRSGKLRFDYLGDDGAPSWSAEQRYSINPFIFGDALAAPFVRIERDEGNRRLAIANVPAMATCGMVLAPDAVDRQTT